MRLIPGSECLRVYSILGTRPWRNSGAGAGAGISDSRFDPRHIPGCVLMCCTNTSAFGSGAVGFPADPLVDGNMEAAGVGAWTAINTGVLTKNAAVRPGSTGTQSLDIDDNAANGGAQQTILTSGNTYRYQGWARSVTNGTIPKLWDGAFIWVGTAPVNTWEYFDVTSVASSTMLRAYSIEGAPGHTQWDDITITPLNSSQFTDLTGLGHHLVQATPASRPLWVASGSGGVLRGDGVADNMQASFALVQPTYIWALVKGVDNGSNRWMIDGKTDLSASIYNITGTTGAQIRSGATILAGPTLWNGSTHFVEALFNGGGTASYVAVDGGTPTAGAVGTTNAAGITIFSRGGGANPFGGDLSAIGVYTAPPDNAGRARLYRWAMRQKAFLAL